jgi:hypothetical protein
MGAVKLEAYLREREISVASFAGGYRTMRNERPVLLEATVKQSQVVFVCLDRNESEVVI